MKRDDLKIKIDNTEKIYCVYMHIFPNKKVYIGLTKQNVKDRWGGSGNGYKGQPVYKEIEKYGWDSIQHIIVKDNITVSEAQSLEKKLIQDFDSINNGYNVTSGGDLGRYESVLINFNGSELTPSELLKYSTVNDLTTHDITTRLGHGWNIDKILSKEKLHKNIKIEYNGNFYTCKELAQLSPIKDITRANIHVRIFRHGWSVDRALTQPKNVKIQPCGCRNKKVECIYEYNGKKYKTFELLQFSKVEGLTTADLNCRINKHGWDIDRALTQPKKKQKQKFELNGKMYTSKELEKLSPYDNIYAHDITDRIRSGWSVYDAVYRPKKQK